MQGSPPNVGRAAYLKAADSLARTGRHMTARNPNPYQRVCQAWRSAFQVLVVVSSIWQPDRLEKGRSGAHIMGMAKSFRPRLLEVRVIPLKPDQWEWQVCEGETLVMIG